MNQKTKFVGLLAILPIFMIAFAPDYIGEADAATQYSKGTPNQSFGSAGSPVCGGALCSESTTYTEPKQIVSNEVPKVDFPDCHQIIPKLILNKKEKGWYYRIPFVLIIFPLNNFVSKVF